MTNTHTKWQRQERNNESHTKAVSQLDRNWISDNQQICPQSQCTAIEIILYVIIVYVAFWLMRWIFILSVHAIPSSSSDCPHNGPMSGRLAILFNWIDFQTLCLHESRLNFIVSLILIWIFVLWMLIVPCSHHAPRIHLRQVVCIILPIQAQHQNRKCGLQRVPTVTIMIVQKVALCQTFSDLPTRTMHPMDELLTSTIIHKL